MNTISDNTSPNVIDAGLRGVDFSSRIIPDVVSLLDRLRDQGKPVLPVRFGGEVGYLVLGYDTVAEAFMREAELSAADYYERYTLPYMGNTLKTLRGSEFRMHRIYMGAPLLPGRIRERVSTVILPIANRVIDGFKDRKELNFTEAYARLFPFQVITQLLDLPEEDSEFIYQHVRRLFRFPWDSEGAMQAKEAMIDYLRPIARERRRSPKGDILSYLASTKVEGELLDEDDLLDFIRHLYPAAGENTSNGFGLMLNRVLRDRAIYHRVLSSAQDRAAAVEETLRIDPPITMIYRFTRSPFSIAQSEIPEGHIVMLAISTANRDPKVFKDPHVFSLDRGTINHITFGRGPRFCLGAHLARAELRTTLDLMLDRLPGLRLVAAENVSVVGGVQQGPESLHIAFDDVRSFK